MSKYATVNKRLNIWKHKKGYEVWKDKKTGEVVFAHRKLVELFYGKLSKKTHIHHERSKKDTCVQWLIPCTPEEHKKIHHKKAGVKTGVN